MQPLMLKKRVLFLRALIKLSSSVSLSICSLTTAVFLDVLPVSQNPLKLASGLTHIAGEERRQAGLCRDTITT